MNVLVEMGKLKGIYLTIQRGPFERSKRHWHIYGGIKNRLARLKTKVDNLDVDKLKTVSADLSNLSNIVENCVVKKTVHNKLVIKVNDIDTKVPSTSGIVTKIQCDLDKQCLEKVIDDVVKRIPNTKGLVKKTDYNTKSTEIKNKIPSVISLVTTNVVNEKALEMKNKIFDITNMSTKAALDRKASW